MELHADRVNLNRLFGAHGEQFRVPPYQRPYAWQAEQIDDLWNDLISTMDSGHFLGTIVLNAEIGNRPQVIDGQQRLITLLMILGLLRDEYHRLDSEYSGRIQRLMYSDEYATGDDVFRLRTGKKNWQAFRDLILRPPEHTDRIGLEDTESLPKDIQAWNQPLFDNYERLKSRLEKWLSEAADTHERLQRIQRLENAIVGDLQLVAIRVGSVADAFMLFETLNDRGLQLSAADLLKNHLLAQVAHRGGEEQAVRQTADEWDGLIDDLGPDVDVTKFLRHYLLIRFPQVRKDEIFDRFKAQVADAGPRKLITELRSYGRLYGEFEDPNRVEEPEVAEVLKDLKTLRATTCYSALMPARRFLSSETFVEFARLAEVLTYRYSTIVSRDSKELERIYHSAANKLAKSKGTSLEAAREHLIEAMPESTIFKQSFLQQQMGRHYLVRYTLGRIEEHISEEREKEIKPGRKVHIEHIMPKTLTDEWRERIDAPLDEHAKHVDRWGNLSLLYHKLNASVSNKPFDRKKKEYRNSEVELTRRLCSYDRWTFNEINERQKWLSELADRIWSVDALEGRLPELPDWAERKEQLDELLPKAELEKLSELAIETSAEEALKLDGPVRAHLRSVREAKDDDDSAVELAEKVANSLIQLVEDSNELDAHARSLLRGAVEYFALTEDVAADFEGSDGLEDDSRVLNAVCNVLGRDDLTVERK